MIGRDDAGAFFSPDYATARERFRDRAAARGFRLEAHPIAAVGPEGEELTIDVARAGDERAHSVVVVSSGLHGVEGYFGAAAQLALLQDEDTMRVLPRGVALVLVHALNPYGFAWVRRTNEENVDLNRNFLVTGERYSGSPARYATFDALLNPKHPPRRLDLFRLRATLSILRHGMPQLKQAVAGGQYDFPQGLFYGGARPSQSYRILAEHLPRWVGDAARILHFDFHTGLGRWATYQLLVDVPPESRLFAWSQEHFGSRVVYSDPSRSIAYQSRGDLGAWCRAALPDRAYNLLCTEFGTYPPLRVLAALRTENQAHFWARADQPITRWAKHELMERFVPTSPAWRGRSVTQGVEIIRHGIEACSATVSGSRRG